MWSSWIRAKCSRPPLNPKQRPRRRGSWSCQTEHRLLWQRIAKSPMKSVQLSLAHPQYWPVKYTTSSLWSKQNKSWTEGAKSQSESITATSHVKHVRAPQKRAHLTNIHQPSSSCTICTHVQKGNQKKKSLDCPGHCICLANLPEKVSVFHVHKQAAGGTAVTNCSSIILGIDREGMDDECCSNAEARDLNKERKKKSLGQKYSHYRSKSRWSEAARGG